MADPRSSKAPQTPPASRRWRRWVRNGLLTVLAFIIALILFATTNAGTQALVKTVLDRTTLPDSSRVTTGYVAGNLFKRIELVDVRWIRPDDTPIALAETLRVQYRLLPLLRQRFEAPSAEAIAPQVWMRQDEQGAWDLMTMFAGDSTAAVETSPSSWQVEVGSAHIDRGTVILEAFAPGRDSTYRAEGIQVELKDVTTAPALALQIETLAGQLIIPQRTDPAEVSGRLALTDGQLTIDQFQLTSAKSDVRARGGLWLPGTDSLPAAPAQLEIESQPLTFDDIRLFVPQLMPQAEVDAFITVSSTPNIFDFEAALAFSDSGRTDLSGAWHFPPQGPLNYRLEGTINQLNPGLFAHTIPLLQGRLDGALEVNLVGPSLENLSGPAVIHIDQGFLSGHAIDSTRISLPFRNGTGNLSMNGGIAETQFDASGQLTPFLDRPEIAISGLLQNLDLQQLDEAALEFQGDVRFRVDVAGLDPNTMAGDVDLRLDDFAITSLTGDSLLVTSTLADGRLSALGQLYEAGGQLSVRTRDVSLSPPYAIPELTGTARSFDVNAALGDTVTSAVSGRWTLAASGTDPASDRWQFDGLFRDIRYAGYALDSLSTAASLEAGQLDAFVRLRHREGTAQFTIQGRPFDEIVTFNLPDASFADLNLAAFLADTTFSTRLSGQLSAEGHLKQDDKFSAESTLLLTRSAINAQPIEYGAMNFDVQGDTVQAEGNIATPEGGITISGLQAILGETPQFEATNVSIRGVNIAPLTGTNLLQTELNVDLEFAAAGASVEELVSEGLLIVHPSQINQEGIRRGRFDVSLIKERLDIAGAAEFTNGRADLEGFTEFGSRTLSYGLETQFDHKNLGAFVGRDSLQAKLAGALQLAGEGSSLQTASLTASLVAGQGRYEAFTLDTLHLDVGLTNGIMAVDTLWSISNVGEARGSGIVPATTTGSTQRADFSATLDVHDAEPLSDVLGIEPLAIDAGYGIVRMFGPADTLSIDIRGEMLNLIAGEVRLGNTSIRLIAEADVEAGIEAAELDARLRTVSLPGVLAEAINLQGRYEEASFDFTSTVSLDANREAAFDGTLTRDEEQINVLLERADIQLGRDLWALDLPATFQISDHYRVRNLLLYANDQQVAIDGYVNPRGNQNLVMTFDDVRVEGMSDLFGFEGLGGVLNGYLDLQGPADQPKLEGGLNFNVEVDNNPAGRIDLITQYDSLSLAITARMIDRQSNALSASGYLPVDLRIARPDSTSAVGPDMTSAAGDVHFDIAADSFAIAWVVPFLDPELVNELGGTVTARMAIRGTSDAPVFSGEGRLVDGILAMPFLGTRYEDIQAELALEDRVVQLREARLAADGGTATAQGTLSFNSLTTTELDIAIVSDRLPVINTRPYKATASSTLTLSQSLESPSLSGNVTLLSADIDMGADATNAYEIVPLTEQDLLALERNFGIRAAASDTTTFDFYEAMALDLDVTLGRDTWLRSRKNPEMNIQFSGSLEVNKSPYADEEVIGSIDVAPQRSYIKEFGKRFAINRGELTFNGPSTDPLLDIGAQYEVPARRAGENAVTINMDARGRVENLDLTLSSEPAMELTDILSYIATGRPANDALEFQAFQNGGIVDAGAGFALNQGVGLLSNAVETLFEESSFELDVIQIEPLPNARGATITAGKYVSPRLFTAVSQPIGGIDSDGSSREVGTVVTLELELLDTLLLRLLGGESTMQINLLWQYAY